ncbi:DUF7511 domain-containing protein [Halosolutus gelatinilyticus]|uniref:DUF7511 domain-containing protein n=1 Tax=Halosolutus gelatinilyticus TaxID=2931975 RepID=UPI001FF51197|nr:hypothetical protein [Halosolutus gelatinilyticus]
MTVHEASRPEDSRTVAAPLELLTDDEDTWTAVPVDARGDDRVTQWLSIEAEGLCDLEDWQ